MEQWMSIDDAVAQLGVSKRTIYRRIQAEEIQSREVNGQREVCVTINDTPSQIDNELVTQLRDEIDYLRQQNDHLTQVLALAQKNISALTEQLQNKDLLLEDMRQRQNLWQRVKARLGWGTVSGRE